MRNYIYSLCGLFFCLPLFAQSALNWAIYQDSLAQTTKIGVQKQLMMRYYEASFTYNQAVDSSWRLSKYQEAGDLALVGLAYAYLGAYKRPYVEELTALVQDQLSWAEEQAAERLPYYYLAYHYLGYLENLELPAQKERLDKALLWLEKNEENYHELLKLDLYREGASFHFGLANEPETALKWAKKLALLQQPHAKTMAYLLMAQIYRQKGNYERTLEALAALEGEKVFPHVRAKNLASRGICYYKLGQEKQALPYLLEAAKQFEDLGMTKSFYALETNAYLSLLDQNAFKLPLTEEINRGGHAQFPLFKAYIHKLKKNKDLEGIQDLAASLADARRRKSAFRELAKNQEIYIALGEAALALDTAALALRYFDEALRYQTAGLGQQEGLSQLKGQEGLAILWGIYRAQKQINAPLLEQYKSCQTAISLAKELEKQLGSKGGKAALREQTEKIYESFLETAIALEKAEADPIYIQQAFIEIELAKGSWLLSSLRNKEAQQLGNISAELLAEERSLRQDISYYQAQFSRAERKSDSLRAQKMQAILFQKRQALEDLLAQLAQKYPSYSSWQEELEELDLAALQEKLAQNQQSLLAYFMGPKNSYCFLLEAGEIQLFSLGTTQPLRKKLQKFQRLLQRPKEESKQFKMDFIQAAHALYQQLMPQAPKHDLLISPHAELAQLAFSSLLISPEEEAFSRLNYLIKQYAISYLYAANFYLQNSPKRQAQGFLAMAPTYEGHGTAVDRQALDWTQARKQLQPLAGAEAELNYLEKYFKGQFLRSGAANEQQFRELAPHARFIHLAMHAITDPMAPSYSALFFSETQDSLLDDLLLAYELPGLNLSADLVVLSACQTAAGRYQAGEGAQSLGLGFRYAGAASTLSTLWEVNDESSRLLMELFYSNLEAGQTKDKALQNAQVRYLELVDQKEVAAQPFFWAAWVLSGDSQAVDLPQKTNWSIYIWGIGTLLLLLLALGFYWRKKQNHFS
ncbi:CHAT domain-containing protein [Saprospira sp. CCB-QB6]|uniref:CHAT domain-containing protein n=1 Tax=Saprospira sp. CCB-QB6 TaxID=3023936 RepID=UPI002349DDE3|nr:CHAT domain-containing protein [Saprospira sp. CCB-QB6]WCL82203.1 CHAT domain-containing protein [Saprospira sp. CCB-QB6]